MNHPNRSKSGFSVTTRDVTVHFDWIPGQYVCPAGTEVMRVGGDWAIRHEHDAVRITGNLHDSHYRYLFVPTDAVK